MLVVIKSVIKSRIVFEDVQSTEERQRSKSLKARDNGQYEIEKRELYYLQGEAVEPLPRQ